MGKPCQVEVEGDEEMFEVTERELRELVKTELSPALSAIDQRVRELATQVSTVDGRQKVIPPHKHDREISSLDKEISSLKGEIASLKKAPGAVPSHTRDYVAPSALAGFVPRKEWVEWGEGVVGALDSVRRELAALKEEKAGVGQFADKKAVDEFAREVGVRFRVVDKSLDQLTALLAKVKGIEGFLRANVELGLLEIPKGDRATRQRDPSTLGRRGQQT